MGELSRTSTSHLALKAAGSYAGSIKAKPIDPIVVLPADRSGNRYAHDLAWIPPGGRVVTIIDREELGNPQGDLFFVDTASGRPTLAWTSPAGQETWSVESFAVSDDGAVVTFLTNPSNPESRKSSSVWMLQVDGSALERFALPVELENSQPDLLDRRRGCLRDCSIRRCSGPWRGLRCGAKWRSQRTLSRGNRGYTGKFASCIAGEQPSRITNRQSGSYSSYSVGLISSASKSFLAASINVFSTSDRSADS